MPHSPSELASEWIFYISRRHPDTGDLRDVAVAEIDGRDDAAQKLIDLILSDPRAAFEVVTCILSKTSDPWILENVGAGPLEELLSEGDEATIKLVQQLAGKYPNTKEALRSVWTDGFPLKTQQAVERILQSM